MTALRLRLQKELFDVTEEQLVSDLDACGNSNAFDDDLTPPFQHNMVKDLLKLKLNEDKEFELMHWP